MPITAELNRYFNTHAASILSAVIRSLEVFFFYLLLFLTGSEHFFTWLIWKKLSINNTPTHSTTLSQLFCIFILKKWNTIFFCWRSSLNRGSLLEDTVQLLHSSHPSAITYLEPPWNWWTTNQCLIISHSWSDQQNLCYFVSLWKFFKIYSSLCLSGWTLLQVLHFQSNFFGTIQFTTHHQDPSFPSMLDVHYRCV